MKFLWQVCWCNARKLKAMGHMPPQEPGAGGTYDRMMFAAQWMLYARDCN
jgi:hypothetical protein